MFSEGDQLPALRAVEVQRCFTNFHIADVLRFQKENLSFSRTNGAVALRQALTKPLMLAAIATSVPTPRHPRRPVWPPLWQSWPGSGEGVCPVAPPTWRATCFKELGGEGEFVHDPMGSIEFATIGSAFD